MSYEIPSKTEWDLTKGPLSKLLELLDTPKSGLGVSSVGPVGDFLEKSFDFHSGAFTINVTKNKVPKTEVLYPVRL